ncbi:ankyrin repeat domain-containing protein [Achromobacter sp. NCFB-sbj8-Ac1-l]|uniref:ankyrin repeat domain-containing protein n=1 Tax=unclassified Achromobacter TaxID=2626865 RepID=UPI004046D02F
MQQKTPRKGRRGTRPAAALTGLLAATLSLGAVGLASTAQAQGPDKAKAASKTETRAGAAQPPAARPAPGGKDSCDCSSPYRDYKAADTADTRALFAAVEAGDEAAFTTALAKVARPGDYALEGVPLLHALLTPPWPRSKHVYWDMPADEAARLRQAHRDALPARTRMLAALLATQPPLNDITYESRRSPVQLALLYGSPGILDMLLAAGARADQRGDDNRSPLDFLLNRDFEFAVRMTYLPRLVDRQDTTRMVLALLKAGAPRPFAYVDDHDDDVTRSALKDAQGKPRFAADYLAWPALVELTEGADVVRALAATGTRPAYGDGISPLALAAYTGNAGAVSALREMGPRTTPATGYGETGDIDLWLDAAQAAVVAGHGDIAELLLRAGMPFSQRGPQTSNDTAVFVRMQADTRPILNLAAGKGDVATVKRLLALGAPVEGDSAEQYGDTPLADAVQARQREAARALLAAGANPALLRQGYDRKTALERAIEADDPALLRDLLAATPREALQALLADPAHSPVQQALRQPGKQGAALLRQLVDAGLDPKTLDAGAIRQALENGDAAMATYLMDAGVPVNPPANAVATQDGAFDRNGVPPLMVAVTSNQPAMVDALLVKGADPLGLAPEGRSALYWAVASRNGAVLERLLRAGAKLDDPRLPRAPARYALLNAALAAGDMKTVNRVAEGSGQTLAAACLPEGGEYALLDQPGYFAQLQAAGFTGAHGDCVQAGEALPQRLLSALLRDRQLVVARRDTVIDVLSRLKASGASLDARGESGETPLVAAIQTGRADLADALLAAGASADTADGRDRSPAWVALETGQPAMLALLARYQARFDGAAAPQGQSFLQTLACQSAPAFAATLQAAGVAVKQACPPAPAASKGAARSAARLAGHYYLRGMREVGSELLLTEDGRFQYLMSYGAVDIEASGQWRSDGKRLHLDTPPIQPFSAIAGVRADTLPAQGDGMTVRVYYQGRPVKVDVAMSSATADFAGAPKQSEGASGVSAPIEAGQLKALAVYVPLPSGARWHDVDISKLDAQARAVRVDLDVPESASLTPLHMTLALHDDGALTASQGGRELRYEKE